MITPSDFRIDPKNFRLRDAETGYVGNLDKKRARDLLDERIREMRDLHERFYVNSRYSLLVVIQAHDAAGKDGTVKAVVSGLNPMGIDVIAFKAPTPEELSHDFLWRVMRRLPARGHLAIFNRSHYEEVLIARVRPEILAAQRLPDRCITEDIWDERYEDINAFERYLTRNGTKIVKIFLNVSKAEQKERFLSRINTPDKQWKFAEADLRDRAYWDDFQDAFQDMLESTSTDWAPWHVVPADRKWFTRLVVAEIILDAMRDLDPQFPVVSDAKRQMLIDARRQLEDE
ncbi:MAG: polyphosphate kinase 2 family protein [Candidatus Poribacteria bacterium]|nr:polyphosphate kinase 2 family protein [Candidatus Poribacteria bacterium]